MVLRSSVAVYGSGAKNPGDLTEERGSILPPGSPQRRRLELEELALEHGGACMRLSTVLAPEEGDLLARQLNATAAGVTRLPSPPRFPFSERSDELGAT